MRRTIEIIGENNFLKIMKKYRFSGREEKTIREILDGWDELVMTVPDTLERIRRKKELADSKISNFLPERKELIFKALLEITSLLVEIQQRRH